jgi:hypothetical protein
MVYPEWSVFNTSASISPGIKYAVGAVWLSGETIVPLQRESRLAMETILKSIYYTYHTYDSYRNRLAQGGARAYRFLIPGVSDLM